MYTVKELFESIIGQFKEAGTFKEERIITSAQSPVIRLHDGEEVINFCANNYLGLANSPELVEAAKEALDRYGCGMSSVRFICGTLDIHKQLEDAVSDFLGLEDTVLYSSCFDANGGLFETILTPDDVVISDELNHASIIDGIRLCKAKRMIYKNSDSGETEELRGTFETDFSKTPIPLSIRNIPQLDHGLYTIIKFTGDGTLTVADFSTRWRVRPVAFQPDSEINLTPVR